MSSSTRDRAKILVATVLGIVFVVTIGWRVTRSGRHGVTVTGCPLSASTAPIPTVANLGPTPPTTSGALAIHFQGEPPLLPPIDMSRLLVRNPFADQRAADVQNELGVAHDSRWSELPIWSAITAPFRRTAQSSADGFGEPDGIEAPAAPANAPPQLSVTAIITGNGRPAALIGEQLYFEYDYVTTDWQIVAIHRDHLVVQLASARSIRVTPSLPSPDR